MEVELELEIYGVARLRVSGEQEFVKKIVNDFQEKYALEPEGEREPKKKSAFVKKPSKSPAKVKKTAAGTETFETVSAVHKDNAKEIVSNFDVYQEPTAHPKKVALFVYIMSESLGMKNITIHHIFSCYKLKKNHFTS